LSASEAVPFEGRSLMRVIALLSSHHAAIWFL
jgi:hypothetical protein